MQTFQILYTSQKAKKTKTWQDGTLSFEPTTCIATLFSEAKEKIDKAKVKPELVVAGGDLEFSKHLVQIESNVADAQAIIEAPPAKKIFTPAPKVEKKAVAPSMPLAASSQTLLSDAELLQYLNSLGEIKPEIVQYSISLDSCAKAAVRQASIASSYSCIAEYKQQMVNCLLEYIEICLKKKLNASIPIDITSIEPSQYPSKRGNSLFEAKKYLLTLSKKQTIKFAKDDCWIISKKNAQGYSPVIAVSTFHGPSSDGKIEVKFLTSNSQRAVCSILRNGGCDNLVAFHSGELSTELLIACKLAQFTGSNIFRG